MSTYDTGKMPCLFVSGIFPSYQFWSTCLITIIFSPYTHTCAHTQTKYTGYESAIQHWMPRTDLYGTNTTKALCTFFLPKWSTGFSFVPKIWVKYLGWYSLCIVLFHNSQQSSSSDLHDLIFTTEFDKLQSGLQKKY